MKDTTEANDSLAGEHGYSEVLKCPKCGTQPRLFSGKTEDGGSTAYVIDCPKCLHDEGQEGYDIHDALGRWADVVDDVLTDLIEDAEHDVPACPFCGIEDSIMITQSNPGCSDNKFSLECDACQGADDKEFDSPEELVRYFKKYNEFLQFRFGERDQMKGIMNWLRNVFESKGKLELPEPAEEVPLPTLEGHLLVPIDSVRRPGEKEKLERLARIDRALTAAGKDPALAEFVKFLKQ